MGDDEAIHVHLDKLLADRGMTMTELARRVGITLANMGRLKNNHASGIRFSTLMGICRVLECQPGDVLSYARLDAGGGSPAPSATSRSREAAL